MFSSLKYLVSCSLAVSLNAITNGSFLIKANLQPCKHMFRYDKFTRVYFSFGHQSLHVVHHLPQVPPHK